jgi:hypothetical protein
MLKIEDQKEITEFVKHFFKFTKNEFFLCEFFESSGKDSVRIYYTQGDSGEKCSTTFVDVTKTKEFLKFLDSPDLLSGGVHAAKFNISGHEVRMIDAVQYFAKRAGVEILDMFFPTKTEMVFNFARHDGIEFKHTIHDIQKTQSTLMKLDRQIFPILHEEFTEPENKKLKKNKKAKKKARKKFKEEIDKRRSIIHSETERCRIEAMDHLTAEDYDSAQKSIKTLLELSVGRYELDRLESVICGSDTLIVPNNPRQ